MQNRSHSLAPIFFYEKGGLHVLECLRRIGSKQTRLLLSSSPRLNRSQEVGVNLALNYLGQVVTSWYFTHKTDFSPIAQQF